MIEDAAQVRAAVDAGALRRVLVIRVARVGDTLHVRPAIDLLRRALPDARITLLCSDYARVAADGLPVDAVVAYPHKGRTPGRVLARRRVRRELAAGAPYDLCLALEDKPWGRALARDLGCRFWHSESTRGAHVVERKAGVLDPLGLWPAALEPPPVVWAARPAARARARARLGAAPRPWVGVQVGSHAGRRLLTPRRRRDPAPAWLASVARELTSELGGTVVIHSGLGGSEARAARRVAREAAAAGAHVRLLEDLDLGELGGALAELDAYVSANTGPLHLAAAAGVPVVLLDGPSIAATHPWRARAARVLNLGLPCSPCRGTEASRRCGVPRCLDEIPPGQVVAAVRQLLSSPPAAPAATG